MIYSCCCHVKNCQLTGHKTEMKWKINYLMLILKFYAPDIKWLGHKVVPRSVIPTFRPVIPSSFTFQSLSQQQFHTFNSDLMHRCVLLIYTGWVRIWFRSNDFYGVMLNAFGEKVKNSQFPLSYFWRDA